MLLGYARHLLAVSNQLSEALSGGVTVTVRIGLPDDFVAGKTMASLAAFNRKHPKVKLEITGGLSRDLMGSYDRGELDWCWSSNAVTAVRPMPASRNASNGSTARSTRALPRTRSPW